MKKNRNIRIIIVLLVAAFCQFSCSKMSVQVAKEIKQLPEKVDKKIMHQIILTGDAGHSKKGISFKMTQMMHQVFEQAGEDATMVLLGDNIKSINENKSPKKFDTPANLSLINLIKRFKGKTYFLPGDLEWLKNDQEGVNMIEKWVQDKVDGKDNFIPDDGCPGPEVEELTDNLVLIAFDSRWFIEDWNTTAVHNESCDIRTRESLLEELEEEIKGYYRTHNIVLAMHHPIFSTGSRGGYASAKDHLFPFSNIDGHLPIPLPVVGSVITFVKKKIPSRQDILHPVYQTMATFIDHLNRSYPGLIVASAHEFNLQLHRDKTQHYIVSGSLVERASATLTDSTLFTYGGLGISRLNFYEDGEVEIEFVTPGYDNTPEVIFRKKIKDSLPTVEELTPDNFPRFEQLEDSISVQISSNEKLQDYSDAIWGELYTDFYFTDLRLPIMNLDTVLGGLTPIQRGGGQQTLSVRLKDKNGQLYQLRSIKKRVAKLVPPPFNKTFVADYMSKQLTAGNPFAAITLAPMEDAIGVFHSNPKLVYLPKQPGLKEFNDIGNEVYLFEERPDENWSTLKSFGNSENIVSHFNMREELLNNPKAKIDQPLVLKTRLFDMLIGDWDRHGDQWRWASYEDDDENILYKPIPRDRDQAFVVFGGAFSNIMRTTTPDLQKLQSFDETIKGKDIRWLCSQARDFDRAYLNSMDWNTWQAQVEHIQTQLTDDIIDQAMSRFPLAAKQKGMDKEIGAKLKSRRDNLLESAKTYFEFLYKDIHIHATHNDNLIEVERLDKERTKISIYEYQDDKKEQILFHEQIIYTSITRSVVCYGLDGDDDFRVIGEVEDGIKVRLVGGNGTDNFEDKSKVKGFSKKTIVYDDKNEKTILKKSSETSSKISNSYKFNHYKYRNHLYNYDFVIPTFGFNQDEGFQLNAIYIAKSYSFKKVQNHKISASYAFGNNGIEFKYGGVYSDVFGKSAMTVDAIFRKPKFVYNFYGLGNETLNLFETSDYYRVRQERLHFSTGLRRYLNSNKNIFLDFAPSFDRIKIRKLEDDFLSENLAEIDTDVFENQDFLGMNLGFQFSSVDKENFPSRGLRFKTKASLNSQIKNDANQFGVFGAEITCYHKIGRLPRLVFASKIGVEHLTGQFNFYYATRIGGNNNLRGYANERFTGRTSFYHTTDLRIRLLKTKIARLPTSFGITTGFDYGRVWIDDENSNKWHTGYGAHLWMSPYEYFVISTGMFFSKEDSRFSLRFGFHF